ncbi:hypothetical protein BV20DRAFT_973762 [Pilatotrama ljubarskyi]|nr:hypothetical protein BV20DRAFT_973762 [Pilatotrama ljubarskyi]
MSGAGHSPRSSSAIQISRSLQSINSRTNAAYYRPCLLLTGHKPKSSALTRVYLLASFHSRPMHTMPQVVQSLSIPIFPNLGIDTSISKDKHIHSYPEWPAVPVAWLVAYQVTSRRSVKSRWYHKDDAGVLMKQGTMFDDEQMGKLELLREERLNSWRVRCEDLTFLKEAELEFLREDWGTVSEVWDIPVTIGTRTATGSVASASTLASPAFSTFR